jgi:hypothetical protein
MRTNGLSKQEAIEMMELCKHEIADLRGVIGRLEPKAEAYDAIVKILSLIPGRSQGATEDLAWILAKRIRELKESDAEVVRSAVGDC